MLIKSYGISIEPRLIEILSGVGLGAFWLKDQGVLFLSCCACPPDIGISAAFQIPDFSIAEEYEIDGTALPMSSIESFRIWSLNLNPRCFMRSLDYVK